MHQILSMHYTPANPGIASVSVRDKDDLDRDVGGIEVVSVTLTNQEQAQLAQIMDQAAKRKDKEISDKRTALANRLAMREL